MYNSILIALIGIVAGVLSGLFGIGGGVVIIPALIYLCGFEQLTAQGTSLAILLPPVGILAFMQYYKKGNIDIKAAIIICVTMLIASMFGAKLAQHLPAAVLKKAFAFFLMAISIKMLLGK
jgi:uncharacterized protein